MKEKRNSKAKDTNCKIIYRKGYNKKHRNITKHETQPKTAETESLETQKIESQREAHANTRAHEKNT